MLKIADFANFGPDHLGSQIFPDMRFAPRNSKYSLVSHIFELGYLMMPPSPIQKCLNTPHLGPGLTFSLLAKVFAKGKMFWYLMMFTTFSIYYFKEDVSIIFINENDEKPYKCENFPSVQSNLTYVLIFI